MFNTLSSMPIEIIPMSGDELASIEGKSSCGAVIAGNACSPIQINLQFGVIGPQVNFCFICIGGVSQGNLGSISQGAGIGN
jgi:hypothetical protein